MTTQDQNTLSYAAGWYADRANPGSERYYDGAAWSQETRPATATPPAKPKKKRKWPWIVAGVPVALVVAIVAITGNSGSAEEVADKPAAVEEVAPEPAKEVEPVKEKPAPVAPVAKPGSLANPWPVGDTVIIDRGGVERYTFTARMIDGDAWNALYEKNYLNDPAPEGMKYVLMEYTINRPLFVSAFGGYVAL